VIRHESRSARVSTLLTYQSSKHFEHKSTETPPINTLSITVTLQNLGSCTVAIAVAAAATQSQSLLAYWHTGGCDPHTQVLGSTTESGGTIIITQQAFLGNTKVGHADVTIVSEQQVLGLEITVENTAVVQVFKTENNLGAVEASALLGELFVLLEMEEQLATVDVIHDKVQLLGCLE
jgi:hypothetical protein